MRRQLFCLLLSAPFCTALYADPASNVIPISVNYSDQGLTFSNPSGSFQTSLSGYMMADAFEAQHGIAGFHSGTNIRYARLNLDATILTNWAYELGYEMRTKDLTDASIAYNGWKNMYLEVGQFTPNVTFSNWLSNEMTPFLETAMPINAFAPSYTQGIGYGVYNDQLALHVSTYTAGTQDTVSGRSPIGSSMRFLYSPFHTDGRAFEVGLSSWYYRPDSRKQVDFSTTPEIQTRNTDDLLDTGNISSVTHTLAGDLETVYVQGPWSAEGEYLLQRVNRDTHNENLQFGGYYVTGSYFLTGESYVYSFPSGLFSNISPIHNKSWGAWEVLAQWSHLNLDDEDVHGGRANNATLGLDWYPNNFFEFKLDYVHVMANPTKDGRDANDNIVALRTQVQF